MFEDKVIVAFKAANLHAAKRRQELDSVKQAASLKVSNTISEKLMVKLIGKIRPVLKEILADGRQL